MNITPFYNLGFMLALLATSASADIGYQFVNVGNPGNANDTVTASDGSGLFFGAVNYTYDIGKYDVTLNQYTTFLNAVASSDPYGLYDPSLGSDQNVAGIAQSGSSGSFSYSVIGDGNRPVAYIAWLDAARFCNWLHNGQPLGLGEVTASTEQGAYTLNGDTSSGLESKNANAQYWIPTESEWYKAAYYDPNKGGPGVGGYWTYATKSNSAPGNVVGSGANQANYKNGVYSVTQSSAYSGSQNYLTDVGAFSNSASAYGTYDQNGDAYQWNDAIISPSPGDLERGARGGDWTASSSSYLQSSYRGYSSPGVSFGKGDGFTFRLATTPEPTSAVMLAISGLALLLRRRR